MIKKLLVIMALCAIASGAYAVTCTGSQQACCSNGKMSCCANAGKDSKGLQQFHDISSCKGGFGKDEPMLGLCLEGQILVEGKCRGMGDVVLSVSCMGTTSAAGHRLPRGNAGERISFNCFTYTCRTGSWVPSSSGCECKPGATYYEPCGSCGTVTRTCAADGTFNQPSGICVGDVLEGIKGGKIVADPVQKVNLEGTGTGTNITGLLP